MDQTNIELAYETRELLVNRYSYAEDMIEVGSSLTLDNGCQVKVDLLIKDKNGKPVTIILVSEEKPPVERLKSILTGSQAVFGVIRRKQGNEIPEFLGWRKAKRLFSREPVFHPITDYPAPSGLLDKLLNFMELFT